MLKQRILDIIETDRATGGAASMDEIYQRILDAIHKEIGLIYTDHKSKKKYYMQEMHDMETE